MYKISPRARRVSIKIDAAKRGAIVIVPGSASNLARAQKFANEKRDWINVQLEAVPPAQPFVPGGQILFRGDIVTLTCNAPRGRPRYDPDQLCIDIPALPETFAGRTRRYLKRQARAALTDSTQNYAAMLGKSVAKISIRDTRSRWGSCKKGRRGQGGEISYSWRLICAPPFVLDYVAAHECAHLVHGDHSRAFWDQCEALYGDIKKPKRWLSTYGSHLHAVGAEK